MKLIFALATVLIASTSHAGREGGGGKGVVCRNAQNEITTVELLDLWEARTIYQRPAQPSTISMFEQVDKAVNALRFAIPLPGDTGDSLANRLSETTSIFKSNSMPIRWLNGIQLSLTNDSFELATPTGCSVEQLVIYQDSIYSPLIVVNDDLYQKMDAANRAALIVHEALYHFMRATGAESDSIRVRRAVGLVFSGYEFSPIGDLIPPRHYECSTDMLGSFFQYYIFEGADNQFYATASRIGGRYAISSRSAALTAIRNPVDLIGGPCVGDGFVRYGIAGGSEVDYDRSSYIKVACVGGRSLITASTEKATSLNSSSEIPLQCREVVP